MIHHLVSEANQKAVCVYCGCKVSDKGWISDWHLTRHYKTRTCCCGKPIRIHVDFESSGHDSWGGCEKLNSARSSGEEKISIVERIKILERRYPKK